MFIQLQYSNNRMGRTASSYFSYRNGSHSSREGASSSGKKINKTTSTDLLDVSECENDKCWTCDRFGCTTRPDVTVSSTAYFPFQRSIQSNDKKPSTTNIVWELTTVHVGPDTTMTRVKDRNDQPALYTRHACGYDQQSNEYVYSNGLSVMIRPIPKNSIKERRPI